MAVPPATKKACHEAPLRFDNLSQIVQGDRVTYLVFEITKP